MQDYRRRGCSMTLQEVADLLGMSRSRVAQIEGKALRKLALHPILRQLAEDYGLCPTVEE
jgi:DNA-directed RNA polymerase sigma subunit (sigma70/sigma32)